MPDLNLAEVDVVEFLTMLDIQNVTDDGVEARFSCPYPAHGMGDRTPSAYMNLQSTAWTCFSCGESGNAITFLADFKQVPRLQAKDWIAQKWAPSYANIENLREYAEQIFARSEKAAEPEASFQPLSEDILRSGPVLAVDWQQTSAPWAKYMFDRGFSAEILDRFGFSYDTVSDRPAITVRDRDGGLVGFKGRTWKNEERKYMVAGDTPRTIDQHGIRYGFEPYDASRFLFAANLAQPIDGWLVLCEGEFNVVSMHQKGFHNVIGPSGSTLSNVQVRKVVEMCNGVTVLFDTDQGSVDSYVTARSKLLKVAQAFEPYIDVKICADHSGDPAEMSADDLKRLIDEAKSSTRFQAESMLHNII